MSAGLPLSKTGPPIGVRSVGAVKLWPKAPVLGWADFLPIGGPVQASVAGLRNRAYTTSGRAALLAALRQIAVPAGSGVLVPTYHCPTMVAPVVQAGLQPHFYPLGGDGLPLLQGIDTRHAAHARVMFVAHFFGLPQGLHAVRDWCSARGIVLVEDCAHTFFGQAGDRAVGQWGDFATASLSKFFPVPEGGLLASGTRPLVGLGLARPSLRQELKSALDVVELAQRHGGLAGLAQVTAPLLWAKNRGKSGAQRPAADRPPASDDACADMLESCDMARTGYRASVATRSLHALLPTGRLVARRRQNFTSLLEGLAGADGARPLVAELPAAAVPYVFPLWVEGQARADAVYAATRAAGLPVFRWDRIWPGTPRSHDDAGSHWQHQVLQLLCHQSLGNADIARVCADMHHILRAH